jgi:hypothetical protein
MENPPNQRQLSGCEGYVSTQGYEDELRSERIFSVTCWIRTARLARRSLTGLTGPGRSPSRQSWTERQSARSWTANGFSLTAPLLTTAECAELAELFDAEGVFRSTVIMARHQFGEGVYRYFDHPLPAIVSR